MECRLRIKSFELNSRDFWKLAKEDKMLIIFYTCIACADGTQSFKIVPKHLFI